MRKKKFATLHPSQNATGRKDAKAANTKKEDEVMKIIQLKAENIKNLKAIEITPEGNVVTLTGVNGAGKSAILDSIFTTLTGQRIEDAIRHGEDKANVEIDMGDFVVKKTWTKKGEYLKIEGLPKGRTPQSFLNEIIGELSFDPLDFANLKPKNQMEILKDLVGISFEDIEEEESLIYQERTAVNSKIKDAIAQLKNTEAPDPKTPDEEIAFKAEIEKMNQLREKRSNYLEAVDLKKNLIAQVTEISDEITGREAEIKKLTGEIEELRAEGKAISDKAKASSMPPEVTENQVKEVELALDDIEQKNVDIRAAIRYRQLIKDGDKLKKKADALGQRLERFQQDRSTRIANATFPLEGLALTDEAVSFDGILFNRLSTGQQIKVSTAIAMKLNPTARIIFIREGSLLDDEGLRAVAEMAKNNDYQVWIEKIDESGKIGFYIEDGSVVAK